MVEIRIVRIADAVVVGVALTRIGYQRAVVEHIRNAIAISIDVLTRCSDESKSLATAWSSA